MDFTSPEGERRYAALVRAASSAVVALDFDGTLSPIVDDPEAAHIHPEASDVLVDNTGSQNMHRALGFEETDRVVYYRKPLLS